MITLIAEKPSVGMELARLTGCRNRHDGYMDGGRINSGPLAGKDCCVTWAIGHLLEIGQDDATAALHWKNENLPVIPSQFLLVPRTRDGKADPGVVKQLKIIQSLFARSEAIVNCGDAGREGELIQRYILQYCVQKDPHCNKPVWRMWTSSMTDEALREGIRDIRPGKEYDNLYEAGRSRNEADWLVGINATEALTLAIKKQNSQERRVFSLGRVQTPTLALVCRRYLENKDFKPEKFWTVKIKTEKRGVVFDVVSDDRFKSFEQANSIRQRCEIGLLTVKGAEHKTKTLQPPLLHDLTSLQQEASKRHGFDPDETLKILQKLYEAKLVTYPRTGSRFISHDVLKTIPGRIRMIVRNTEDPKIKSAAIRMQNLETTQLNRRSVNDGKVTDHHALLVEATPTDELTGKEAKIFNLIAARMLEAFATPCECDVYGIKLSCAGVQFSASTTKIIKNGWKGVLGEELETEKKDDDAKTENQKLPELSIGDVLPVKKAETVEGMTKPKPIYTMNTLLEAMKTAGKDSDDDDIKAAMKDIGIGTPATRAAILKTLIDSRHFLKKESGEKVLPTETGMEIYSLVKDMKISSVELTGDWEIDLNNIADGNMSPRQFDMNIREYTKEVTRQIQAIKIGDGIKNAALSEEIKCPCCGGVVKVWDQNAKCTNKDCGLYLNRTVFGKKLGQTTIKHLLETGQTGIVKGFVSTKTGKQFSARLQLEITEREGRKFANARLKFDDVKPKKPWNGNK